MAVHTVFESTNMRSTDGSERIFDCVATEDIDNGMIGGLGELAEGMSHVYKFEKGAPEDHTFVIVDQPAWSADTTRTVNQRRDAFYIPAGTVFRARVLARTDEFGITKAGFTSDSAEQVKVGAYAVADVSGRFKAQAEKPQSGSYCKIMRKRTLGSTLVTTAHTYGDTYELYELRVIA